MWRWRGRALRLSTGLPAWVQLALSASNWSLIAALVFVLLPGAVRYTDVLSVLLVAAVVGVIAHMPAGLGVLEAAFISPCSVSAWPRARSWVRSLSTG